VSNAHEAAPINARQMVPNDFISCRTTPEELEVVGVEVAPVEADDPEAVEGTEVPVIAFFLKASNV